MAIYADFGKIKGSVTAEGFKDHIELASFGLGSGRNIFMEVGKGTERESTAPNIGEVSMNKTMDRSSSELFAGSMAGKAIDKVEIKFVKTSEGALERYLTYTLHDVLVSAYNVSGAREQQPTESLSLAYTKIELKYHPRKSDNTKGSAIPVGYDVSKGKKL